MTRVDIYAPSYVEVLAPGRKIGGRWVKPGQTVFLSCQSRASENGVWIWHGPDRVMTRSADPIPKGGKR